VSRFLALLAIPSLVCCGSPTGPLVDTSIKEGTVAHGAQVRDVAYDSRRNTLYLSQPDLKRIAVLRLSSLSFDMPISTVPYAPSGIDLSLSGDSLVASLQGLPVSGMDHTSKLGFLSLTGGGLTFSLEDIPAHGFPPDYLRVVANGKAVMTVFEGGTGEVITYQINTRTGVLRNDVSATRNTPMARSGDRSHLLLLHDNSCCPETAVLYDPAQDTFGTALPTVSGYGPAVSTDRTGAAYLLGNTLFSSALAPIRTLTPPGYSDGTTAITPDGKTALMATDTGALAVSTNDGSITGTYAMGTVPIKIFVLYDGRAAVLISATEIQVRKL
jgi:hypothetical protein